LPQRIGQPRLPLGRHPGEQLGFETEPNRSSERPSGSFPLAMVVSP